VTSPEPPWIAILAMCAVGGLFAALPPSLIPGPYWLMPAVVGALVVPGYVTHRAGNAQLNHRIGIALSVAITIALVFALGALIHVLPSHRESAVDLLRSAVLLWLTNILVFASWYWRLDAGGPHQRSMRGKHVEGAFLFPQMTLHVDWTPDFVDYVFLAFNTSTAFSPTDTAPLSRWAKVLMMIQSLIALSTIAILAGRAVNIL